MNVQELSEELETTIAAHDLSEEHADRVRELVEEGTPILDAIKRAGEEQHAEPAPAPPSDDPTAALAEPSEAMLKALGREVDRHEKSVRKIMGVFVEGFTPCSTCDGLGLEQPGPKPRTHPFFAACETCSGFGKVLTGSLEEQYTGVTCPDCGGRGYLEAMMDNTPAVEIVNQVREQRKLMQAPTPPVVLETPGEGGSGDVTMGRPSWMGDPALGQ